MSPQREPEQKLENKPYSSTISVDAVMEHWEKELMQDPKNRLAASALSTHDAKAILTQRSALIADSQKFNVKIDTEGAPITKQALFAATNVFRVAIMKRYNLKEFELSQAYLFYWDKLEKANYCLEQVLDTVDEDLEGRMVQTLLAAPVGDGGIMSSIITSKLREDAIIIRRLATGSQEAKDSLGAVKEKMMREIHGILTLMLGPPPNPNKEMTWEYYDRDDKFQSLTTTPLKYAGELSSEESRKANSGTNINELFSLVNDPRNKYKQLLSVSRLGNVVGLRPVRYVNVDMTTMKN
ncbi:MAG: hypothetical protein Q9174_002214, partial [Haloplaca sp. 1 TL-2023]